MNIFRRFRPLFRRKRFEADMAEELNLHIARQVELNLAAGLSAEDARYAAYRQFGGLDQLKEEARDARSWLWLENLMRDFRFAVRSLRTRTGFAVAVIATLALGIGASTALYAVADRVIFRAPPYPEAGRLVVLGYSNPSDSRFIPSQLGVELVEYRQRSRSIDAFASLTATLANLVVGNRPQGVRVGRVSLEYFAVLGGMPVLGRAFLPDEFRPGQDNVVVISHELWQTAFASDPKVLERVIQLDAQPCRVIGVLPRGFVPPLWQVGIYRPYIPPATSTENPFADVHDVIARLRPGVTPAQAQDELRNIRPDLGAHRSAKAVLARRPTIISLSQNERGTLARVHWLYLGTVVIFFAIACSNALNLSLTRTAGRGREFSVRLALGCGRWRLLRMLLVENLLLTTLAGLLGLLVANWFLPGLLALAPAPAWRDALGTQIDGRTVLFATALGGMTALLITGGSAWRLGASGLAEGLKESSPAVSSGCRTQRMRSSLVILQTALAVTLLTGTGLMLRSVHRLLALDRGFNPTNKHVVWIEFPGSYGKKSPPRSDFCQELEARVRAIPGVEGVTLASNIPTTGTSTTTYRKTDGTDGSISLFNVTPGFLKAFGLHLLKGTWFSENTPADSPLIVLNESAARELCGQEDPVGRSTPLGTVIGVVADLRERPGQAPDATVFSPLNIMAKGTEGVILLLRVRPNGNSVLAESVCRAVFAVNPLAAVMAPFSIEANLAQQIATERYTLNVLRSLAALALVLAALGLFSLLAYLVAQRTREIGIRLALGASTRQIFHLILERGLALASAGVACGVGLSWALTRFMRSLLFETAPNDPWVFGTVVGLLLAVSALAAWLPARRAAMVNPVETLRAE